MCGRYVVISKISEIEARFGVYMPAEFPPNFNIAPGSLVPVISSDSPEVVSFYQFGLTPFWAKKRMYFFNARSEGDQNSENDPTYRGAMGILSKPAFRKAIRSQRCLIIADAFIEGSTSRKLDEPYLVHLAKNERPFAFAGIWDEWVDRESGEVVRSCAIVTTQPNALLQKIPHHRSPVILERTAERTWLDTSTPLSEITALLKPYEGYMNAYPISTEIKNSRHNYKDLLEPKGPPLETETTLVLEQNIVLEGMGFSRARSRKRP